VFLPLFRRRGLGGRSLLLGVAFYVTYLVILAVAELSG
jgi:hypothetical protein